MLHRFFIAILCLISLCTTRVCARLVEPRTGSLDSLRVSLLTVAAGPEVYERFGHTAIRIEGVPGSRTGEPVVVGYHNNVELELPYPNMPQYNGDLVFHYGVFNFNAPNFVYRFLKGETDYSIGCLPYAYMLQDYKLRGLRVTEQRLDLSPTEAKVLLERLLVNNLTYNRTYRYSYLFDNCATRPFRLIEAATDSAIVYDRTSNEGKTLRDLLREKTGRGTWLDFGISLIVTGRADRVSTFEERMFLPEYLSEAYGAASVRRDSTGGTAPLVSEEPRTVVHGNPLLQARLERPQSPWTSPMTCACALLAAVALLSVAEVRRGWDVRWLDSLLWVVTGAAGLLVWFMSFVSDHPAVDHNWNCLWLVPTHLLFAALIWIKCCKKVVDFYFFITFVALFVYLGGAPLVTQFVHPAFVPAVLALLIRAGVGSGVFKKLTHRDLL